MPLPVLTAARTQTDDDLLRLFHRTERFWADHLGESAALDCGVAIRSPELPNVYEANRMLEAALPAIGASPADMLREVQNHFAPGVCWQWHFNPSAPPERTQPLANHLLSAGHYTMTDDVMALEISPQITPPAVPGLTILPTRAAFKPARELAEESAARWNQPQLAEAQMLHLDDPHCDSLLALRDGRAVGRVTVLAVGDIGRIDQVYVAERARRQGIGRVLIARAIEICARSLFRHVMLSVVSDNTPAIALYRAFGFRRIGGITAYRKGK